MPKSGFKGISFLFRISLRGGVVISTTSKTDVSHIIEGLKQLLQTGFLERPVIILTGANSQTIGVTYYWSTGDNNGKVTIRVLGTSSIAKDSYVNVHLLGTI